MKKIALFALLMLTMTASAQTVTLKDKSRKGDIFKVKSQSLQQSQRMGSMTMTYDLEKSITEASEGRLTATSVVERMIVDISQKGATYRYDSDVKNPISQTAKMLKKQFDPMAKVTVILQTDRLGEVISSKTIPPVQNAAIAGFQFGYPKEPVKVGSTWISKIQNPVAGTLKITYMVTEITSTTVFADFKGASSDLKTMTLQGKVQVDIATGHVQKLTAKNTIQSYEGGKITGKTTITSKKV
jgi:hypothetical protein